MQTQDEWLGLSDAVHSADGLLTYWGLYSMAMQNRIESRRVGRRWLVQRASLDRYLAARRVELSDLRVTAP